MAVAKSYESYNIIGEPFIENSKPYVLIDFKGKEKKVRWYSDKEYTKLYGTSNTNSDTTTSSSGVKAKPLGFDKGYITVFNGLNVKNRDFLPRECRYTRLWGWYLPSCFEDIAELPNGIAPIKLYWQDICDETSCLDTEKMKKLFVHIGFKPYFDIESLI